MIRWSLLLLLLVTVSAGGCSNGASEQNLANGSKDSEQDNRNGNSQSDGSARPRTDSLVGNWYLVVSRPVRMRREAPPERRDIYMAVLKITPDGDGFRGEFLEIADESDRTELSAAQFSKDSADFSFQAFGTQINFSGKLRDGVVWGNLLEDERSIEPARLQPTEAVSLEGRGEPYEPAGLSALQAAANETDRVAALQAFLESEVDSPLVVDVGQQIMFLSKQNDMDATQVDAAAQQYFQAAGRWGPRVENLARLNVGYLLATLRFHPELSLKYFDAIEKSAKDDLPAEWPRFLQRGRHAAEVAVALGRADSDDADVRTEARNALLQLLASDVFNHVILYKLAEDAERRDDVDEALLRYAQLATLPLLAMFVEREFAEDGEPGPDVMERLEKLWETKHGSKDGLDAYLTDVYRRSIYSFASAKTQPAPPDAGNRVVLCELLTGSRCQPCMAADVAVGGLESTYGKKDLIALRYHQHIPGPDPLANTQTEDRLEFYRDGPVMGTPSTYVNGAKVEQVGGHLLTPFVDQSFERLLETVDPLLQQSTQLKINLSAEAKQGQLTISANVEGLETPPESLRLRLALAEDEIEYAAPNQIRLHEMVVRTMPGGSKGVPPQDGKLQFTETIELAEFRQRLVDDMAALEENVGEKFDVDLEPEKLHLVAFVQDDDTREVLQAAAVPVVGTLDYGQAATEKESQPPSETDDEPARTSTPGSTGPELKPPQTNAGENDPK